MSRVLMLLDEEFPPDSRVEKEAISLINDGHQVALACQTRTNKPIAELYKGIEVRRMNISNFTYKLSAACLVVPYFFVKWKLFLRNIINDVNPDIIHVHDLPLSKVGCEIARKFKCKLVCDQHEFYSDWIVHTAHMNTFQGKVIKFLSNWQKYEMKYLRRADLVITVADPLRNKYISKYNLSEEQVITIPNTPSLKIFNANNIKTEIIERYKNNFMIFYAGGIDILRGIDTAIKALQSIKHEIPNAKLVLAGKIIKPYNPLKLAKTLGVESMVEFVGWIKEEEIPSYINASNICFFTPPANREEINNTIATKIYQYAVMGKPIITSAAKLMKEFVERNRLGYAVEEGNFEAFSEAVLKCYQNIDHFHEMKEDMKNALYWEQTILPMLHKYQSLA